MCQIRPALSRVAQDIPAKLHTRWRPCRCSGIRGWHSDLNPALFCGVPLDWLPVLPGSFPPGAVCHSPRFGGENRNLLLDPASLPLLGSSVGTGFFTCSRTALLLSVDCANLSILSPVERGTPDGKVVCTRHYQQGLNTLDVYEIIHKTCTSHE